MNQKIVEVKESYVIRDQTLPHFITATVLDWIDAHPPTGWFLLENHIETQLLSV